MAEIEIVRGELGCGVKSVKRRALVDIPAWILTEVLITMPLKLVIRSKLVSKHWLSVISHPSFALTYTLCASKSSILQPWAFIYVNMYVEGSQGSIFRHQLPLLGDIYSRRPSLYALPCPSAQNLDEKLYKILGVSNGLVLYGPAKGSHWFENYSICNPITKQWITLPPHGHGHRLKMVNNGFVTRVENGILTSYRVVCFDLKYRKRKSNAVAFEVFVSEIGEWKEFDVNIDQEIRFVQHRSHVSLNEISHWITEKHVMAYDPYHSPHNSRIIALPDDVHLRTDRTHMDVFQGRLRYLKIITGGIYCSHAFTSISVWVLNDYNTGDWSLQHSIDSSDILYDSILQRPQLCLELISFHPFDGDIVYFGHESFLVPCNLKTRKMEAHLSPVSLQSDWRLYWPASFLFVVPPWPVHIPHPQPFSRKLI